MFKFKSCFRSWKWISVIRKYVFLCGLSITVIVHKHDSHLISIHFKLVYFFQRKKCVLSCPKLHLWSYSAKPLTQASNSKSYYLIHSTVNMSGLIIVELFPLINSCCVLLERKIWILACLFLEEKSCNTLVLVITLKLFKMKLSKHCMLRSQYAHVWRGT